ncbi:MAG: hypothetical protein HY985_16195 [Magnetospirillum sp.]|nr:hypothetical protein [Magnetospirillum sp.]
MAAKDQDWTNHIPKQAVPSELERLLVPMRIEALSFGRPGTTRFFDATPAYRRLTLPGWLPVGGSLRRRFEPTDQPTFLPPGIHLHWTLPAGFTTLRSSPGEKEGPASPPAPNRWLVTRLTHSPGREPALTGWVVASDLIRPFRDNAEDGVPWMAADATTVFRAALLGERWRLQDWQEPGPSGERPVLTAFAPGNLGFASHYPSCRSAFGFHDRAADLSPDATYAYVVAGWFAEADRDPLDVTTRDLWIERMREMGWSAAGLSSRLPRRTLCHASVGGLRWRPEGKCPPRLFSPTPVLASGIIEAAARLVRRQIGNHPAAETILDAARLAAMAAMRPTLPQVLQDDFLPGIDAFLGARASVHDTTFTAHGGGSCWEVAAADKSAVRLPKDISDALVELNKCQRRLDHARRRRAAERRNLFASWYQEVFRHFHRRHIRQPAEEVSRLLAKRRQTALDRVKALADPQTGLVAVARLDRDVARAQLQALLAKAGLQLRQRPLPRFRRAADPFLLLKDVDAPLIQGGAQPLACRIGGQVLERLGSEGRFALRADSNRRLRAVLDAYETQLRAKGVDPVVKARDMVLDHLLLDPALAEAVAPAQAAGLAEVQRLLATSGAQPRDVDMAESGGSMLPIRALLSATVIDADGEAGSAAPVYMRWRATFTPAAEAGRDWTLGRDDIDCSGARTTTRRGRHYRGLSVIATNLQRHLPLGQQALLRGFPIGNLAGQSLSGLTDALAMIDTTAQLPPIDGLGDARRAADVTAWVDSAFASAPLLQLEHLRESFHAVREGGLTVDELDLIDSFGRVTRVIGGDRGVPLEVGRSLSSPSSPATAAWLRPRLVQPARLELRWLTATSDGDSVEDELTSPICGWVVLNRLEGSLVIHDGRGKALGAVHSVVLPTGSEDVRWSTLPMRPRGEGAGAPMPGPGDIANPHLLKFVKGLLALSAKDRDTSAFRAFRDYLTKIEDSSPLPHDGSLRMVACGQPLAVVRAGLTLELDGPPLLDQRLKALGSPDQTWLKQSCPEAVVHVRLGDRRIGSDGLVGYFVDDGSDSAYAALRLGGEQPKASVVEAHKYMLADTTIPLRLDPIEGRSPEVRLTLLMDPRAGIHMVSGILPVTTAALSSDLVANTLLGNEFSLLVAPALGDAAAVGGPRILSVPLPTEGRGEWDWVAFERPDQAAHQSPLAPDRRATPSLAGPMALVEGWLSHRPGRST